MGKYTIMTEKEFKNIKLLQEAGLSVTKASEVTKRSGFTVGAVFKTNSLAEMKHYNANVRRKPKVTMEPAGGGNKTPEDIDLATIVSNVNDQLSQIVGSQKDISEFLENIDNRLKFLENNIVVNSKRKFF